MAAVLGEVVGQALQSGLPTPEQALALLESHDEELLEVVAAAGRVRRHFFGNRVKLNLIVTMKSGLCPEDCAYCSQRRGSEADVLTYNRVDAATAAAAAARAADLVDAGVHAYNHNLNTSEANYEHICSTHGYADRVDAVAVAQCAGLSPCSGAIFGMGETDGDIVDLAFELRALDPDPVPINFLIPFEGTPLGGQWQLTPQRCLRILAMFRFLFPDRELRIAGGREIHLRGLQSLGLHLANSIFLGDYLTSEGQPGSADLEMIADAGFVVEGHEVEAPSAARQDLVMLRRRGPGTALAANV